MNGIKTVTATPAKIGVVITMWVLGLVLLALFAWATQWRTTASVPTVQSAGSTAPASTAAPGLAALTTGLQQTAASALANLRSGHRSDASHALDAAYRLAQVGQENTSGPLKTAYVTTVNAIETARENLWNGNPDAAQTQLTTAGQALDQASNATETATSPRLLLSKCGVNIKARNCWAPMDRSSARSNPSRTPPTPPCRCTSAKAPACSGSSPSAAATP